MNKVKLRGSFWHGGVLYPVGYAELPDDAVLPSSAEELDAEAAKVAKAKKDEEPDEPETLHAMTPKTKK